MSDSTGPPAPHDTDRPPRRRDRMRDVRMVATGIAVILLVWFAVANLQGVRIRFWLASATAPVIVVIAISGFLGAAVSALVSRAARRRRHSGDGPR